MRALGSKIAGSGTSSSHFDADVVIVNVVLRNETEDGRLKFCETKWWNRRLKFCETKCGISLFRYYNVDFSANSLNKGYHTYILLSVVVRNFRPKFSSPQSQHLNRAHVVLAPPICRPNSEPNLHLQQKWLLDPPLLPFPPRDHLSPPRDPLSPFPNLSFYSPPYKIYHRRLELVRRPCWRRLLPHFWRQNPLFLRRRCVFPYYGLSHPLAATVNK